MVVVVSGQEAAAFRIDRIGVIEAGTKIAQRRSSESSFEQRNLWLSV